MKNQSEQQKDFLLIAKRIKNEQKIETSNGLEQQLEQRYKKQSEQALKMINAYRKVQNVKVNPKNKNTELNDKDNEHFYSYNQPKSSYANKIKQTLRQLNSNKAKEFQKLSHRNSELKSQKKINALHIANKMGTKANSQNERKLILKSTQRIQTLLSSIGTKKLKQFMKSLSDCNDIILQKDFKMARKYRLFRLFFVWKEQAVLLKIQNQKRQKQQQTKQIQAIQMAKQFFTFKTCKKVIKYWSKVIKSEKKKAKYEEQLRKIQLQRHMNSDNELKSDQKPQANHVNNNAHLQNKLRGFLDGLKQKIEHKEKKGLNPIAELTEQSQQGSQVFNKQKDEPLNVENATNQHQDGDQNNQIEVSQNVQSQQIASQPKKPLTNEQLQQKRQQIQDRSKNRKQALQKIKKEKENNRKKQEQERKQLENKIQQEQKKIKELKYREYHERKKLEKQWEEKEIELNKKAQQWNRLRLMRHYGMDSWRRLSTQNKQNANYLKQVIEKTMLRHAGRQLLQNLNQNLQAVLQLFYDKMLKIHARNLKKKTLKGFKIQYKCMKEQQIQLQAFHEVHTQKIYLIQWRSILDNLRLQNLEEERPLVRKANQYHKVCLLFKSLKFLKQHSVESKKEKNINEQKLKIKSKIKNIISEKIQINYDDFL